MGVPCCGVPAPDACHCSQNATIHQAQLPHTPHSHDSTKNSRNQLLTTHQVVDVMDDRSEVGCELGQGICIP